MRVKWNNNMSQPPPEDVALWNKLVEASSAYISARMDFFKHCSNKVEMVRAGLHGRGHHGLTISRWTALEVAAILPIPERQQLLSDLIDLGMSHGYAGRCREIILSLPQDWLLAHLEEAAEPFLKDDTYDHHRRLLELYSEVDRDLTLRLAQRACQHPDPDVREAGEDFMEWLASS